MGAYTGGIQMKRRILNSAIYGILFAVILDLLTTVFGGDYSAISVGIAASFGYFTGWERGL